jgi:hypothetical protein
MLEENIIDAVRVRGVGGNVYVCAPVVATGRRNWLFAALAAVGLMLAAAMLLKGPAPLLQKGEGPTSPFDRSLSRIDGEMDTARSQFERRYSAAASRRDQLAVFDATNEYDNLLGQVDTAIHKVSFPETVFISTSRSETPALLKLRQRLKKDREFVRVLVSDADRGIIHDNLFGLARGKIEDHSK